MEWHICQEISQKYEEKGELAVCIEEIPRTIAQLEGSFPESDLSEPPPETIEAVLGGLTMDIAEDAEDLTEAESRRTWADMLRLIIKHLESYQLEKHYAVLESFRSAEDFLDIQNALSTGLSYTHFNVVSDKIITAEEEEQSSEATGGETIDTPLARVQEFMRFRVVHACRSDRKTVASVQSGKEELGKSQSRNILDYATPDDVMKGIEPYLTEDG